MFQVNKQFSGANIGRTVRFPEKLFEQLSTVAGKRDVSMNSLILQCCQYALDHMKPDEHQKS